MGMRSEVEVEAWSRVEEVDVFLDKRGHAWTFKLLCVGGKGAEGAEKRREESG